MEKFLAKDVDGNWNTIPPVPADKIREVNCHKFVLYVIDHISWEDMILDSQVQKEKGLDFTFGELARSISHDPFTLVNNLESLNSLVEKSCESGKSYIGQILDAETEETAHSFILEKDRDGLCTCYDKPGFKYPFSVHTLEDIFNFVNKDGEKSNQNQKWRFVLIK